MLQISATLKTVTLYLQEARLFPLLMVGTP